LRETLTIFAGLLILILTTALVGPYLVDWTAQRGWIEKLLSDATGAHVEVAGAIDVKLLPTPSLRLEKVVMQGAAAGDASFRADVVELEMAVPPLLRGDVQFIKADFAAPEVHLARGADGSLVLPHAPAALTAAMQFSAISLHDGRLTIDDPSHQHGFSVAGLDLDAEAGSLVGPFKGAGRFTQNGSSIGFRFSTTAWEDHRLTLKASVDASANAPAAEFEGALHFAGTQAGASYLSFEGTAGFSGTLALPDSSSLAWKITGPVTADAHRATFASLDLRLGDEARAMTASGSGEIDFDGTPQAHATLSARQIDLDRLLAPKEGARADPDLLVQALAGALADPHLAERLPLPLALALASPTALLGGETLTDISVDLHLQAGAPVGLSFQADGPGRSHLALSGAVETGAAAVFKGHVEAAMHDTPRLADWLGPALPQLADRLRSQPFRAVDLAGDMDISAAGFVGRGMRISADRSTLSGTFSFTRALGQERARFFADLGADALDLDALPDLSGPAAAAADTDLALTLDARAVRVTRFGEGMIDAGHIHLALTKAGAKTELEDLSIADLGGASVSATGEATPRAVHLDAKLDAARLNDLAELIRRIAPGAAANALAARATALSPAHLGLTVEARSARGELRLAGLRLTGTVRGTQIDAAAGPDSGDSQAVTATIGLDSGDTPMLLRQIGLETLPLTGFGHGKIAVALSGRPGQGFDTKLDGSLAGTDLTFRGRVDGSPLALRGQGAFTVKTGDLSPLLAIATFPLPDATARLAADLAGNLTLDQDRVAVSGLTGSFAGTRTTGDLAIDLASVPAKARLNGALAFDRLPLAALTILALGPPQPAKPGALWPDSAFGASLAQVPTADIAISAGALDLPAGSVAADAKLRLNLAPGTLTLSDVEMKVGDGRLGGRLTLRRDGSAALVAGTIQLAGLPFHAPYVSGQASGSLDFAASGQSEAALVAGLAGSGTVQLAGLTVEKSDPGALARVITQTDQSAVAVDEPEVRSALGRELDHSGLHCDDAAYDATLAAGVLRLAPKQGAGGPEPAAPSAGFTLAFDLRRASIEARVVLTSKTAPRDWNGAPPQVAVVWRGPVATATRDVDGAEFFNALAARALVRASARLDMLERDIRERAYFNRYLKGLQFLHRREQEVAAYEAVQARQAQAARQAEAAQSEAQQRAATIVVPGVVQNREGRGQGFALPAAASP
jgi:uncharacterized protein involved in outer membrane biogenesis